MEFTAPTFDYTILETLGTSILLILAGLLIYRKTVKTTNRS